METDTSKILTGYTNDQAGLLIALPYRVGLWVSESDIDGGEEAQEAEQRTLEALICGFVEDCCKCEFVELLMRGTLQKKETWHLWNDNLDKVPDECQSAISLIEERLPPADVDSFKQTLIQIAYTVAMAFVEYEGDITPIQKLLLYTDYLKTKLKPRHGDQDRIRSFDDFLSISMNERKALSELEKALGL